MENVPQQDRPYTRIVDEGVNVSTLTEGQMIGWKGGEYPDEIYAEYADGGGGTYWTTLTQE